MRPVPSLSVIIPVYNEEAEIARILDVVSAVLTERGGEWEIIVIDNASTDATAECAAPHVTSPRIRMLRNESNRGKGFSVRRGMLAATGELRLMCDADCAPSLESLPAMEALTADADIVAGARNAPDSQVGRYQPLRRRVVSFGFILLCRLIMAEPLRDVFCGFKLFTAEAAEATFPVSRIDGWVFDAEILALARARGLRVRPCGIAWTHRPASRLSIPRVVVPALLELVRARASVGRRIARDAVRPHPTSTPPS